MKHWKWLLAALLCLLPLPALAELQAQAVLTPSELVMPQQVTLTVTGTNEGAQDIKLCDMEGNVLCDMGSDASLSYTAGFSVTQEMLDDGGVSLLLRYNINGAARSTKLNAKITKMAAAAQLSVTRSAETENGETVLLYRIHNSGNVALRDIAVKDDLCGAQAEIESLAAGEKKTLRVVVSSEEDIVSQPTVTAVSVFDGKNLRCDVAPLKITEAEKAVTAYAECIFQSDGTSLLRVTVTNTGTGAISGIRVTEESLGIIGSITGSLAPGEKGTVSRALSDQATKEYALTVSDGEGNVLTRTELVSVCAEETGDDMELSVTANAQRTKDGTVTAQIVLSNKGDVPLRDVVLSETHAGTLRTLSVLPVGETQMEVSFQSEGDSAQFLATLSLANGGKRTAISSVSSIETTRETSAQQGTLPQKGAISTLCAENVAYPRMLIVMCAIITSLLLLFLAQGMQKKNQSRRERDTHLKNLRRTKKSEREDAMDPKEITKEHKIIKVGEA